MKLVTHQWSIKRLLIFFSILVFDRELEGRRVLEFLHDWSMCVGFNG